jgi:hypothetical protein
VPHAAPRSLPGVIFLPSFIEFLLGRLKCF